MEESYCSEFCLKHLTLLCTQISINSLQVMHILSENLIAFLCKNLINKYNELKGIKLIKDTKTISSL